MKKLTIFFCGLIAFTASCTQQPTKPTNTPATVTVVATKCTQEEETLPLFHENDGLGKQFTPQRAIYLATEEPLEYFAVAHNQDFGPISLLRNSRITVLLHYCKPLEGIHAKGPTARDTMIAFYTPDGESIRISAGISPETTLFKVKRNTYRSLMVTYMDVRESRTSDTRGTNFMEELARHSCLLHSPAQEDHLGTEIRFASIQKGELELLNLAPSGIDQAAFESFWKEPGERWYDFLALISEKIGLW